MCPYETGSGSRNLFYAQRTNASEPRSKRAHVSSKKVIAEMAEAALHRKPAKRKPLRFMLVRTR
jgi:hypothetical protein